MSDLPEGAVAPRAIDLVHELHRAVYGDSWARPETPSAVWADLLAKVREMSGVPDPEPEWVPKAGDGVTDGTMIGFIVATTLGAALLSLRWVGEEDSTAGVTDWYSTVDRNWSRWALCGAPEWTDEIDTGRAEVPWAALQNTILQALQGFNLGRRAEITGRVATRVADLLEAHGVEVTDKA